MTNKENLQLKSMDIVAYPESCNVVEAFEKLVKNFVLERYAYILHDKDTDENGEVKKPHYHIYIAFTQRIRISTIAKIFNTAPNNINAVKQYQGLLRYYCHMDNPEKHQYCKEDLILKNIRFSEIVNLNEAKEFEIKEILTLIDVIHLPDTDIMKLVTFALDNNMYYALRDNYCILRDIYRERKSRKSID